MKQQQPENIVMLQSERKHENSEPASGDLRKELTNNQKQIRRMEGLITKKREKLAEMSNSINHVLEKQLEVRLRQPSFLDVLRQAELHPKLKLKLDELAKLERQCQHVKTSLSSIHGQRDSQLGQKASHLINTATKQQREIEQLRRERNILRIQNQHNDPEKAEDAYSKEVKQLGEMLSATRKELKELEKKNWTLESDQQLLTCYCSLLEEKLDEYEEWKKSQRQVLVSKDTLSAQATLLTKANADREEFERSSADCIRGQSKAIKVQQLKRASLQLKIREVQNVITRSQMDSKFRTKRSETERGRSTEFSSKQIALTPSKQSLKETSHHIRHASMPTNQKVKTEPAAARIMHRLGSTIETATSIIISDNDISDPHLKMENINVYVSEADELLGLAATYTRNGEIIRGKKMKSHLFEGQLQQKCLELSNADTLSVMYSDASIQALKISGPQASQTVGKSSSGIVRMISLLDYNVVGMEAKIDYPTGLDSVRLVGLTLITERKTLPKKHATNPHLADYVEEDIQIDNEQLAPKRLKSHSQRMLIQGGSLPKINVKQIIDHRLGFQSGRKG